MKRENAQERRVIIVAGNVITINAAHEGQNPQGIQLAVELMEDGDAFKEIVVRAYKGEDRSCVADIRVGIVTGDLRDIKIEGEVRVLITTNGEGDNDYSMAVYPQQEQENAINPNWI